MMKRRFFLNVLALATVAFSIDMAVCAAKQPNIILFFVDGTTVCFSCILVCWTSLNMKHLTPVLFFNKTIIHQLGYFEFKIR